ncbi:MAG: type IV secretory system conjugative DNA transfer family protein, partial [Candidatus Methylacidiphilales bacterium]
CRGWDISGKTGSGKTSSGVIPLLFSLKQNRPSAGIVVLDTKGDLADPLIAMSQELGCTQQLRILEVRPDGAPATWVPPLTMNFLADRTVPYSTYAKLLVDIATAAGQKGGQAFFKTAAQSAIYHGFAVLEALDWPVTIENCFSLITDQTDLQNAARELANRANPQHQWLVDYFTELLQQPVEQLGGVRSTVANYLQPFIQPDIAEVFCPVNPHTFSMNEVDAGALVCVRIPQKYQVEKRYVSLLLKVLFYLHALRRYDLPTADRKAKNLIVLALDEAQETVLVSEDGISDFNVVDKIRGARATTINSTQSPTSYIPPMGGRDKADVFLLNLANKVYFTAADKLASEMIADSIGKRTVKKKTFGRSAGKANLSWTDDDQHYIKPHELRALPKHCAVIKHCERRHAQVRLRPTRFTAG